MRLFLALLWAACCLPAAASAEGVTLSLELFYGGTKIADVTDELVLSADGSTYELQSEAKAVGLAKLLHGDSLSHSSGAVDETHGLLMTVYSEMRGHRKPQRAELADGQLHLQRGEEQRSETVAEPLFDYLSAIYRSYILRKPMAGTIKFTNGWRLTDYEYTMQGREVIDTGMGEMEAVLILRDSSRGERKLWLAPALDYLPVRLYINDKGHEFTTVLQSVKREGL